MQTSCICRLSHVLRSELSTCEMFIGRTVSFLLQCSPHNTSETTPSLLQTLLFAKGAYTTSCLTLDNLYSHAFVTAVKGKNCLSFHVLFAYQIASTSSQIGALCTFASKTRLENENQNEDNKAFR